MRLNSDILYDYLKETMEIRSFGKGVESLKLHRPKLYTGENNEFLPDQLYVALVDQLPANPILHRGTVIVCIGGTPLPVYTTGTCVCLAVMDSTDLFTVNNQIQHIYDRMDQWEEELRIALVKNTDIQEMLDVSFDILNNPMVVIDSEYKVVGYSKIIDEREDLALYRPDSDHMIRQDLVTRSIWENETNMTMRKPFTVVYEKNVNFSSNLFDETRYIGNLSISFVLRPFRTSDNVLSQFLARHLELAMKHLTTLNHVQTDLLRDIFRSLLKGYSLSGSARQYFDSYIKKPSYRCIRAVPSERSRKKIPSEYICNLFENSFPGSAAFEYDSGIVIFLKIDEWKADENEREKIIQLIKKLELSVGVSNTLPFSQFHRLRAYYRQTEVALDFGTQLHPFKRIYYFEEYSMRYMIYSCVGEFPLEMLYSEGFQRLLAFNASTQTDYLETLRVYLNNNMNITKSAEDLYIHRSTFLERMKKIEGILKVDLKDPDERLQLNMLLKMLEIQQGNHQKENEVLQEKKQHPVLDHKELDRLI
ncbi:MAG: PucR family transcriptional regulator [Fusicatenibacter sp.]